MPEFTLWDIIWLGIILTIVQVLTHMIMDGISKWFEKRKNNTIYELFINDEFKGKYTFKRCREIYEDVEYESRKSAGSDKKTKAFYIDTDIKLSNK